MNQEPDARAPRRAPRRRTIAAGVAVGALALGGVAVLPFTGAFAAGGDLTGTVRSAVSPNSAILGATVTSYALTGNGGTKTTNTIALGAFSLPTTGASADTFKVKVAAPGFVSGFYTGTGTAPTYTAGPLVPSFLAGATVALAGSGTALGTIELQPAGSAASTVSVTSIAPLGNDGTPVSGQPNPYPGQRIRVSVKVTAAGGVIPTGFVQIDSGTFLGSPVTGSETAVLAGGTATIDVDAATLPTTVGSLVVSYSGDSAVAPGTTTANNLVVAAGGGTLNGKVTTGTDSSGVEVQVWNAPATGTPTPAYVVAAAAADGSFHVTLPNGPYKVKFAKPGFVSQWNGGAATYTAALPVTLASSVATPLTATLVAQGTATFVPSSVAVNPAQPKVGEPVTFTIGAATGVTGAIGVQGKGPEAERNLTGVPNQAVVTTTFDAGGSQTVTFTYGGDAVRKVGTFTQTVTVGGGAVVSGTVTGGSPAIAQSGVAVTVYSAATNQPVGTPVTTDANGKYSLTLDSGAYKLGFAKAGFVPVFSGGAQLVTQAGVVTVAGAAISSDVTLTAVGTGAATPTATTTGTPTAGQPFSVTVTVAGAAGTPSGTVIPVIGGVSVEADRKPLDATGKATFSFTKPAGALSLTFLYSGSSGYGAITTAPLAITVLESSTVSVAATPSTVAEGGTVNLTAVVVNSTAGAVTGGTVTFKNGTTTIGAPVTVTGGIAQATVTTLPKGSNEITAQYTGTASVAGSTSLATTVTVLPNSGTLLTVAPKRVLAPTAVTAGGTTDITFDAADIPANAKAVKLNVTVSGVTGTTYVSACPAGTAVAVCKQQSSVNSNGDDLRNFVIVPLGTGNAVTLYNNSGTVLLSADLVGWVVSSQSTSNGSVSVFTPKRITDAPVLLGERGWTTVTVDDVPAGASAVVLNVTISGVTGNTFVSGCPFGTSDDDCVKASIINSRGQDRANLAVLPLGGPDKDKVRFYNNVGQVQLQLDLEGYVLGTASAGADGRYQPVTPSRVIPQSTIGEGQFRTVTLANVPAGATAVALNLTAAGVSGNTYFSACPSSQSDDDCKKTSVLNSKGPDTAGFVIVKLGGANNDEVKLYNNQGSNLILGDLQGWVIG